VYLRNIVQLIRNYVNDSSVPEDVIIADGKSAPIVGNPHALVSLCDGVVSDAAFLKAIHDEDVFQWID
jgi:hypothetical protein